MPKDRFAVPLPEGLGIEAMAFREDGSSHTVRITELSFDDCQIVRSANYRIGERLRIRVEGQGWFEAQVQSAASDRVQIVFVTVPTA